MLTAFNVNRFVKPVDFGLVRHTQLHHFADASEAGYGMATYIQTLNQENHIQVTFLLGKARVTPLKDATIPQLKLMADVLAVRVDSMVKAELDIQLEDSVFWTDSTSVLKYLNNEDRRFHTFVANRILTIRQSSEPSQWRHVSTKNNPANDTSRGMKGSDFLIGNRWLKGPAFLWREEEDWPKTVLDVTLDAVDKEVRKEVTANVIRACDVSSNTDQLISDF